MVFLPLYIRGISMLISGSSCTSVVVVGASGSIGSAVVREYIEAGWKVEGFDLNETKILDNSNYRHTVGDFRVDDHLESFVKMIGDIHHLVIVAGGAVEEEIDCSDFVDLLSSTVFDSFNANFFGTVKTIQAFLPALRRIAKQGEDASVTVTGSVNAHQGIGLPVYSASKAALKSLVMNLAVSEGVHGIRVNMISPGTVITGRTLKLYEGKDKHFIKLEGTTSLGRLTPLEEIAGGYLFLSSNMSVSGFDLVVDSGQLAKGFRTEASL